MIVHDFSLSLCVYEYLYASPWVCVCFCTCSQALWLICLMRSHYERKRDSSVHCETNLKPVLASPWNYKGIEWGTREPHHKLEIYSWFNNESYRWLRREGNCKRIGKRQNSTARCMKPLFAWHISRPLEMSTEVPYSLIFHDHHLQIHPDWVRNRNIQ